MSGDGGMWLLALGPAGATGLYWALYRYYRNTDKSHDFEHETAVVAKPITGDEQDRRIDVIKKTRESSISGNNVSAYRTRVERIKDDSS